MKRFWPADPGGRKRKIDHSKPDFHNHASVTKTGERTPIPHAAHHPAGIWPPAAGKEDFPAMNRPLKIAMLTTDARQPGGLFDGPLPSLGTAPEALLQGFAGMPEIEIHVVSCVQRPVISPEKIAPNIFYHSLRVPKLGWLRTLYQGCIHATRKKLRELKPDLVHGQGTERDCAISAVFSGFPNVLTIHGNMRLVAAVNQSRPFSFLWLTARLERFTLPRTDGVVCITNYTREAVKNLARRTWVLPNAVDASFFEVPAAPDCSAPPIILCVGAICLRKNQNDFIRALDPLAARRKIRLIFVGRVDEGAYGGEFRKLVSERMWCEHVPFSGRDRVREFFRSAAAVALPTREDNCPMVVLEAMAAGVPVLASNVGGVPDLIEHEVNGLLCDPQQPETFREAVAHFLDDRTFAGHIAAEAKTQAQRRFHPEAVARRHLEIYREVLKNQRP
jgi:glycosyltransferase involved in cell wall biosynthesis